MPSGSVGDTCGVFRVSTGLNLASTQTALRLPTVCCAHYCSRDYSTTRTLRDLSWYFAFDEILKSAAALMRSTDAIVSSDLIALDRTYLFH